MKKLLLLSALLIITSGYSQSKEQLELNDKIMAAVDKGNFYDAVNLSSEMLETYEDYFNNNPIKEVMTLNNMGQWLLEVNEFDAAITFFNAALKMNYAHIIDVGPDKGNSIKAEILINLGVTYSRKKQESIAFNYYDEAVRQVTKYKNLYGDYVKGMVYTKIAYSKYQLGKKGYCKDSKKADKYAYAYPLARELFYQLRCY